ncbi:MAG TPA: choice-of-anchor D domain-containing protein, partial [Bryobacteraceae bacterium]|nr:choice-of-anchor D domain-containing protein [Bryobacteraceae bacterium]
MRHWISNNRNSLTQKAIIVAYLLGAWTTVAQAQTLVSAPTSQGFGQATLNSTAASQTLAYTFSGTLSPSFSVVYNSEYSLGSAACTGSGNISCTVSISFRPTLPGLRQGALLVKDHSNNLIGTTLLYGTGLGPQLTLYPGVISTVAGTGGSSGYVGDGGLALAAYMNNPQGIAIDNAGNLYIADSINQVVRQVSAATGRISTVAGIILNPGYTGDGGLAVKAKLSNPVAVALDGSGNLYIADQGNNVIRKVNAVTGLIVTVAGGGTGGGTADGLGDGGPATNAILSGPNDVAIDGAGNLFIADSFNGLIRRVDAASGIITVALGTGLQDPTGVAVDPAGNLYIADTNNSVVRRMDTSGKVTVVAGTGVSGYTGDLGLAISAKLMKPACIRLDAAGDLYIADQAKNVIRQVNAQSGIITTIAGTGAANFSGDGGLATGAVLSSPTGVALDSAGNIYIADTANNVIRKISKTSGLTFPSTLVGEASPAQTLTIANIGNQPLTFASLTINSNFSQQTTGAVDCSSSIVLGSSATCMIGLAFTPTTTGNISGSLALTDNNLNVAGTIQNVALSGAGLTGAVPQLSFSPASLTFAAQAVGTSSSAQSITVTNLGTAALNVSSIQFGGVNGSDFNGASTCHSVLAAKASCSLSVIFSPTATGSRTASLIFVDNLANSPQALSITGVGGTPQIAFSPSTLVFANQSVGTTSPATA